MLLIFQICISRNPGMCKQERFSKIRSHLVTDEFLLRIFTCCAKHNHDTNARGYRDMPPSENF